MRQIILFNLHIFSNLPNSISICAAIQSGINSVRLNLESVDHQHKSQAHLDENNTQYESFAETFKMVTEISKAIKKNG